MLERMKVALVESYVGAIALGYLFAQGLLHFASIFIAPVAGWVQRREFRGVTGVGPFPEGIQLQEALPDSMRSAALLVLGYLLLRWLYFKPPVAQTPDAEPAPEQDS
jgi:hypothetical protein